MSAKFMESLEKYPEIFVATTTLITICIAKMSRSMAVFW
jgi:hypothetical protein